MKKAALSLFFLFSFYILSQSQQVIHQYSDGGRPWSEKFTQFDSDISWVNLPYVDVQALMDEDLLYASDKSRPFRFGWDHYVSYTLNNSGSWHTLSNGDQIWRLGLISSGAVQLSISFKSLNLPPGCRLFVMNADRSQWHGAFTQQHVSTGDQMLGTEILNGDMAIVELYVPQSAMSEVSLEVFRVTHAYKDLTDFITRSFGQSGACMNNVRCPAYTSYDNQIRSVVCLVNGGEFCTGALINNTCNDATPYVLTANHCGSSGFGSWTFRFN